jgi:uncharacterized protein YecE (DUF72 family)
MMPTQPSPTMQARMTRIASTPPLIGCAGWNIPAHYAEMFTAKGTHLERYAHRFSAVEINSSFYRSHRPATYRRWAASVPETFRFAVKMVKTVTHAQRLRDSEPHVQRFLDEVRELEGKLGCVLIQLPPSAACDVSVADAFFAMLRKHYEGPVACEPRHASWFEPAAVAVLQRHAIGRVGADPPPHPGADEVTDNDAVCYFRLHGSPRMYYDAYTNDFLQHLAARMRACVATGAMTWCIFDNTALGHATGNAMALADMFDLPPHAR